jgi:hypothetical protein
MGIDGTHWIWLAQDRVQWQAFVNTVMNLWVPLTKQFFFFFFFLLSGYQLFK